MQSSAQTTYGDLLFLCFHYNSFNPYVLPLHLPKINRDCVDKLSILEPTCGSEGFQYLRMGDQTYSLFGLLVIVKQSLSESDVSLQEPVNFFKLFVFSNMLHDSIMLVVVLRGIIGQMSILHIPIFIFKFGSVRLCSKFG